MHSRFDRRYLILALLFMAKTMPQVFFMMALPVILRIEGFSLELIGLLQLASVPYLLKFLWAPFLDRGGLNKGHYKRWTLYTGLVGGILLIAMGFLNVVDQFQAIVWLVMVVSVVVSTQDIAISVLYIKLLTYEERGKGSSSKILALNLASILGSGLFLVLYNHAGWRATMFAMGAMVLLALLSLGFLEEKERKELQTSAKTKWSAFLTFFRVRGMVKWTVLIVLHSISTSAVFFMIKPFLVDRGVDPDMIAFVVGFYGMTIAAVVAMATGNKIFQKHLLKRRKAYIATAVINAAAVVLFIPIAMSHDMLIMLYIAVALLNASITLSSVVSGTLIMDFSRKGFESVDYSLQMTGVHVGGLVMAAVSGFIVAQTGYPLFFLLQGLIGIALVFLTISLFKGAWIPGASPVEGLDSDSVTAGH